MLHSWNSITFCRSSSETFPILCELEFKCIFLEKFSDISKLCLSRNAIASSWKRYMKFSKSVFAKFHLHLIKIIPRYVQTVSYLKFDCVLSKIYEDNLKLCLSRSSIASRRICSQIFSYCVLAKFQLHLIEFNPRFVQKAS